MTTNIQIPNDRPLKYFDAHELAMKANSLEEIVNIVSRTSGKLTGSTPPDIYLLYSGKEVSELKINFKRSN